MAVVGWSEVCKGKLILFAVAKIVLHQQAITEDGHLTNVRRKRAWEVQGWEEKW